MFTPPSAYAAPPTPSRPGGKVVALAMGAVLILLVVAAGGIWWLRTRSAGEGAPLVRPAPAAVGSPGNAPVPAAALPAPPVIPDADGDGVADEDERAHGTDPAKPDTDNDGATDFEEIYSRRSNPLQPDNQLVHPAAAVPPGPAS